MRGPEEAEALMDAPFVVLSHGTEDDPIFNYGNLAAQKLFLEWIGRLSPHYPHVVPQNRCIAQNAKDSSKMYVSVAFRIHTVGFA